MRLEQIEQILEISRLGSMNKAAKKLFLSQPNLSASIRSLEKELGFKIFTRTAQGMVLTQKGQELLFLTAPVLLQFKQANQLLRHHQNDSRQVLRVSNVYLGFVEKVYLKIQQRFSGQPFFSQYREVVTEKAIEDVENSLADIATLMFASNQASKYRALFEYRNLTYHSIGCCPVCVFVRKNHPLVAEGKKIATVSDLNNYPMAVYASLKSAPMEDDQIFGVHHAASQILTNSRMALLNTLKQSDAIFIGVDTSKLCKDEFYEQLFCLNLELPQPTVEIGYICQKKHVLNEPNSAFIQELEKIMKKSECCLDKRGD